MLRCPPIRFGPRGRLLIIRRARRRQVRTKRGGRVTCRACNGRVSGRSRVPAFRRRRSRHEQPVIDSRFIAVPRVSSAVPADTARGTYLLLLSDVRGTRGAEGMDVIT